MKENIDSFKIHNKYKELGGKGLLINPSKEEIEYEKLVMKRLKEYIQELRNE